MGKNSRSSTGATTSKLRSRSAQQSSLATAVKPFYADRRVELLHADLFELLDRPTGKGLAVFDHLITDPPYAPKTHEGARTGDAKKKLVNFSAWTFGDLHHMLALAAMHVRRWAVFTCDDGYASRLAQDTPFGWAFIRKGVWIKPGAAPQFTGDRPGQGWESIVFLHRVQHKLCPPHMRIKWNGGGRDSPFRLPQEHQVRHAIHASPPRAGLMEPS